MVTCAAQLVYSGARKWNILVIHSFLSAQNVIFPSALAAETNPTVHISALLATVIGCI